MPSTALLVAQLLVILSAARAFGWLAERGKQPAVIGERLAGRVLGPLVFGALASGWQATLFQR